MNPIISVIMPAYNCERYIRDAIASILLQKYEPIEIVIVDDGSIDKTLSEAALFGKRVKILQQANLGPAAARNLAIKHARADLLAFLDADDLWLPGKLQAQLAYMSANPHIKIVYGRHVSWRSNSFGVYPSADLFVENQTIRTDKELSGWIYPELLLDSHIHIITALIHRQVYDDVGGFDGTFFTGSDYDFWLRASRHFEAHRLAMNLALYRIHPQSITAKPRKESSQYNIVKRALHTWGFTGPDGRVANNKLVNQRMAQILFQHGYLHFKHGDIKIATSSFHKSLQLTGPKLKLIIYIILSVLKQLSFNRMIKNVDASRL